MKIQFKHRFYIAGSSLVLTIPAEIVDALNIKNGDDAFVALDDDGRIVVEKRTQRT